MQLAQLNIAQLREPLDSELLREFRTFIDPVNRLAEESPGFVWRLQGSSGESSVALETPFDDDSLIVNLSTWESLETLRDFAFTTAHAYFVRKGKVWFHRMDRPHMVLWWVADGHRPDLHEAKTRLERLHAAGPGPLAFHFGQPYPPAV